MTTLNYALSAGSKTLNRVQAIDRDLVFQVWYTGIIITNITIEVWVTTDVTKPFVKIPVATKTLVPADGTAIISLSGLAFLFVEFRVIAPLLTEGTIVSVDVLNGVNVPVI